MDKIVQKKIITFPRRIKWAIKRWLRDHAVVWCAVCHKALYVKEAKYERANTGENLPLCPDCHKMIFNPYSSNYGNINSRPR